MSSDSEASRRHNAERANGRNPTPPPGTMNPRDSTLRPEPVLFSYRTASDLFLTPEQREAARRAYDSDSDSRAAAPAAKKGKNDGNRAGSIQSGSSSSSGKSATRN